MLKFPVTYIHTYVPTYLPTYLPTYIHKLYLSSDFSVAYKLVSPILITNFKSYSKNKAKKRKKIHNIII